MKRVKTQPGYKSYNMHLQTEGKQNPSLFVNKAKMKARQSRQLASSSVC